jgi:cullin 3
MKVPLVAAKEVTMNDEITEGDGGSVPVQVEEDRRHMIEATVVRIMKARRTSGHNDLVAETTKQLSVRFVPTPQVCL